jgi:alginate O-acetyltransferase complex protein AlgI
MTADPTTWPPWVVMWATASALFAACKWMTLRGAPSAPTWRQAAYLFAWPGMDAAAFLGASARRPSIGEWLFAAAKLALGVGLVWGVVRHIPSELPLVRGWVGMIGVVFVLHFGAFHLLSCAWRSAGANARPLMHWPVLAGSVSDFWGRRWNTAFRDLTHRFLFRPLAGKIGPRGGLFAGFVVSGLVHELVITVPAGGAYGLPTLYFVLQGTGLLAERSLRLRGWRGRLFAATVIVGPAGVLFPPPFVNRVVLPFLSAIGAC